MRRTRRTVALEQHGLPIDYKPFFPQKLKMFDPLEMHVVEFAATPAAEMVVIRVEVRIVARRPEALDGLQKPGAYKLGKRVINSGSRQLR